VQRTERSASLFAVGVIALAAASAEIAGAGRVCWGNGRACPQARVLSCQKAAERIGLATEPPFGLTVRESIAWFHQRLSPSLPATAEFSVKPDAAAS